MISKAHRCSPLTAACTADPVDIVRFRPPVPRPSAKSGEYASTRPQRASPTDMRGSCGSSPSDEKRCARGNSHQVASSGYVGQYGPGDWRLILGASVTPGRRPVCSEVICDGHLGDLRPRRQLHAAPTMTTFGGGPNVDDGNRYDVSCGLHGRRGDLVCIAVTSLSLGTPSPASRGAPCYWSAIGDKPLHAVDDQLSSGPTPDDPSPSPRLQGMAARRDWTARDPGNTDCSWPANGRWLVIGDRSPQLSWAAIIPDIPDWHVLPPHAHHAGRSDRRGVREQGRALGARCVEILTASATPRISAVRVTVIASDRERRRPH